MVQKCPDYKHFVAPTMPKALHLLPTIVLDLVWALSISWNRFHWFGQYTACVCFDDVFARGTVSTLVLDKLQVVWVLWPPDEDAL